MERASRQAQNGPGFNHGSSRHVHGVASCVNVPYGIGLIREHSHHVIKNHASGSSGKLQRAASGGS